MDMMFTDGITLLIMEDGTLTRPYPLASSLTWKESAEQVIDLLKKQRYVVHTRKKVASGRDAGMT